MTSLALLLFALQAAAPSADAANKPDAMAGFYGNTVVFTAADGHVVRKITYNKDGTYQEVQGSRVENGRYVINNGQDNSVICQTIPRGTFCHDFKASAFKHVGDSWTSDDGRGPVTHTLVAGRN
jgi:hypothetical protein